MRGSRLRRRRCLRVEFVARRTTLGSCRRALEVIDVNHTRRLFPQTEADGDRVRRHGRSGKRKTHPGPWRARHECGPAYPALPLVVGRESIGDPAQRRRGCLRVCLIVQREVEGAPLRDEDGTLAEVSLHEQLGGLRVCFGDLEALARGPCAGDAGTAERRCGIVPNQLQALGGAALGRALQRGIAQARHFARRGHAPAHDGADRGHSNAVTTGAVQATHTGSQARREPLQLREVETIARGRIRRRAVLAQMMKHQRQPPAAAARDMVEPAEQRVGAVRRQPSCSSVRRLIHRAHAAQPERFAGRQ
jgi:hypothetical protein